LFEWLSKLTHQPLCSVSVWFSIRWINNFSVKFSNGLRPIQKQKKTRHQITSYWTLSLYSISFNDVLYVFNWEVLWFSFRCFAYEAEKQVYASRSSQCSNQAKKTLLLETLSVPPQLPSKRSDDRAGEKEDDEKTATFSSPASQVTVARSVAAGTMEPKAWGRDARQHWAFLGRGCPVAANNEGVAIEVAVAKQALKIRVLQEYAYWALH
jgi:hypothetical protein